MKVFLYYAGFGATGGITTRAKSYAETLIKQGHSVTIGGLGRAWWKRPRLGAANGARYITGHYLPKHEWFRKWGGVSLPEARCARIIQHLRSHSYDIVHCMGWNLTNVYVFWAGLAGGARTLYTATGHADREYPPDFVHCGRLLDAVHGPAHSIAETIARRMHLDGQYYVFPASPDRLSESVELMPDGHHSIGFVGQLEDHKQVARLVGLWPAVLRRLPTARLRIFGRGTREGELRDQVSRLGLNERVTFHGHITDLDRVYSQFAALIVMAKEGMSFTSVEALCAGRSLILPEDGCFPELYGDCPAVRMFSPDAGGEEIAELIAEVIGNRMGEALQKAARKHYEENFSHESVGKQLLACYEDLLSKKPTDIISGAC